MEEMESLEMSARTVEEAIDLALARLGKQRDEVQISILSPGRSGILGIGHEDARILVSPMDFSEGEPAATAPAGAVAAAEAEEAEAGPALSDEEIADEAEDVLRNILQRMGLPGRIAVTPAEGERPLTLNISGADMAQLIGRRGETLASLQLITNSILGRRLRRWVRVTVDVENYRQKREESLRGLAMRVADGVRQSRRPMALEPMPANERRIVHLALADHEHVTTHSIGEGEERKVVISPKR